MLPKECRPQGHYGFLFSGWRSAVCFFGFVLFHLALQLCFFVRPLAVLAGSQLRNRELNWCIFGQRWNLSANQQPSDHVFLRKRYSLFDAFLWHVRLLGPVCFQRRFANKVWRIWLFDGCYPKYYGHLLLVTQLGCIRKFLQRCAVLRRTCTFKLLFAIWSLVSSMTIAFYSQVGLFNFHQYDNLRHSPHKKDPRKRKAKVNSSEMSSALFAASNGDIKEIRR